MEFISQVSNVLICISASDFFILLADKTMSFSQPKQIARDNNWKINYVSTSIPDRKDILKMDTRY